MRFLVHVYPIGHSLSMHVRLSWGLGARGLNFGLIPPPRTLYEDVSIKALEKRRGCTRLLEFEMLVNAIRTNSSFVTSEWAQIKIF